MFLPHNMLVQVLKDLQTVKNKLKQQFISVQTLQCEWLNCNQVKKPQP